MPATDDEPKGILMSIICVSIFVWYVWKICLIFDEFPLNDFIRFEIVWGLFEIQTEMNGNIQEWLIKPIIGWISFKQYDAFESTNSERYLMNTIGITIIA